MDELKYLKRLSLIKSGKNLKFLTPAAYPGGHCPMWTCNTMTERIKNLSSLLIGMPECATYSRTFTSRPEGENGELHWLYVLDENEVVFGCREGVISALKEMENAGATSILMIATCVTDLIGEDFEGLINEAASELNANLAFVTVGQFRNFSYQIGAWKTMEAIGSMMEDRTLDPGTVNALLVDPFAIEGEETELPVIVSELEKKGIKVRKLVPGASLEDYMSASDASLNLVLCSYMQPLAELMKREYGIEYIPLHTAFSIEQTDSAYAKIALHLGIEWDDEFTESRNEAVKLEEAAKKRLNELSYVFLRRVDMPVPLAAYLAKFGMKPELIHVEDFHPEDPIYAKELKEYGFDPPACRMMNFDVDIQTIKRLGVDLCFGRMDEQIEGIRCVEEMGDYFGTVGYERVSSLISRIFEVLDTGKIGGKKYGIV